MTALLKDAIKPNLVQTLEKTPAIIHGGPFANIAHGCNSVIATKTALKLADYVVTEAGFAADLGAEKFLDIKCRQSNLKPNCIVLVITTKAYTKENTYAHINNLRKYGIPIVACINKFATDTEEQLNQIIKDCSDIGIETHISTAYCDGGNGAIDLANSVIEKCDKDSNFRFIYDDNLSIKEKINVLAKEIYHASNVRFSTKAQKNIDKIVSWNENYNQYPICVAKTQYSISDKPELGTTPSDYILDVKDVYLDGGAEFVVVLTGDIMTMPGLPRHPAALDIDVENGKIKGLF